MTGDRHEVKYFGATVNRTLQLAREASSDRLLLTPAIWSDPGVASAFIEHLQPAPIGMTPDVESIRQITLNIPQSHLNDAHRIHEGSF